MGPDDFAKWADVVGPTFIAAVLLIFAIKLIRRDKSEGHSDVPTSVHVDIALLKQDVASIKKHLNL